LLLEYVVLLGRELKLLLRLLLFLVLHGRHSKVQPLL
jgi:hypothetical protein